MLKPNPAEVRLARPGTDGPTGTVLDGVLSVRRLEIAEDAVYRYNLVYHCNRLIGRQEAPPPGSDDAFLVDECSGCHRSIPMTPPVYTCGHGDPLTGTKCSFRSESKIATEYHIRNEHTEHCPVCQLLIGSGDGGQGCGCPKTAST